MAKVLPEIDAGLTVWAQRKGDAAGRRLPTPQQRGLPAPGITDPVRK